MITASVNENSAAMSKEATPELPAAPPSYSGWGGAAPAPPSGPKGSGISGAPPAKEKGILLLFFAHHVPVASIGTCDPSVQFDWKGLPHRRNDGIP